MSNEVAQTPAASAPVILGVVQKSSPKKDAAKAKAAKVKAAKADKKAAKKEAKKKEPKPPKEPKPTYLSMEPLAAAKKASIDGKPVFNMLQGVPVAFRTEVHAAAVYIYRDGLVRVTRYPEVEKGPTEWQAGKNVAANVFAAKNEEEAQEVLKDYLDGLRSIPA